MIWCLGILYVGENIEKLRVMVWERCRGRVRGEGGDIVKMCCVSRQGLYCDMVFVG